MIDPYRENKFHTWIIRIVLVFLSVYFLVDVFFVKDNPETIRFSENSVSYYLWVFGFCSAVYALSLILVYLAGVSESNPKNKCKEANLWEKACMCLGAILWFCSLPAAIVFGGIHMLYDKRLHIKLEREINEKWQERYYYTPCPHCGQPRVEKGPELWEPLD